MPLRATRLRAEHTGLTHQFTEIRARLAIDPAFAPAVEAEATEATAAPSLPDVDARDIAFVTIDPDGSKDLDQALFIERTESGYRVAYAIADLSIVVDPGGFIDQEARLRGQTMYAPDYSAPLHPRRISEDAASLLPGVVRAAYVWRFALTHDGAVSETTLTRSRVQSREQLTYEHAQHRADDGDELMVLLREVGERRIALEAMRGGAALDLPDEEVVCEDGTWRIKRREMLPVEQWNAQISLMTGMEAAKLQLEAGQGILRTMPRPPSSAMKEFRREVAEMGVPFKRDEDYGAFLRRLDRTKPTTVAALMAARSLFRGASYQILTGGERASSVIQAAIGAPYAHATAPLRRLVDRFVLAHCDAIANGTAVAPWAREGLAGLPEIMASSSQKASLLERECVAAVTAVVLEPLIGESFDAIIVDRREQRAELEIMSPPVSATAIVEGEVGTMVRVRLESVTNEKPVFVAS